MKKKIFYLMLSAAILTTSPLLAMNDDDLDTRTPLPIQKEIMLEIVKEIPDVQTLRSFFSTSWKMNELFVEAVQGFAKEYSLKFGTDGYKQIVWTMLDFCQDPSKTYTLPLKQWALTVSPESVDVDPLHKSVTCCGSIHNILFSCVYNYTNFRNLLLAIPQSKTSITFSNHGYVDATQWNGTCSGEEYKGERFVLKLWTNK